jgi:predicted enzyme related to lactoylglutathione lyase
MAGVHARGRFVWFDLMTTDPNATTTFYPSVTGWGTERWDGSASAYTMWTAHGEPLGGVMKLSSPARPPYWLSYIATPDVDDTVARAEDLGARVLALPTGIPTVGTFAVLADPQGAAFAAFTPEDEAPGHEGDPRIGEFSWHELATHDFPAAYRFYEHLFGWEKADAIDMGGGNIYQMFRRNGRLLGGMFNRPSVSAGTPAWLHYVLVEDIERAAAAVGNRGGQVLAPPREVPGGDVVVHCSDPQGAKFALHQRQS